MLAVLCNPGRGSCRICILQSLIKNLKRSSGVDHSVSYIDQILRNEPEFDAGSGFLGETSPLKEALLRILALRAKAYTVLPVMGVFILCQAMYVLRLSLD